jgi:ABC-2 type transport system ATP-binding protein
MKGELWEVRCERRMEAMGILKSLCGVKGAGIFGDKIHVLLEEGDDAEGEIERALHEAGFEILPLRKIAPSLEDVFIASVPEKD